MGGHRNYYMIIESLVIFKDCIEDSSPVADYIRGLHHSGDSDEPGLPDNKEIATALGLKRTKVNEQLKKLYDHLISNSRISPPRVKDVVHKIRIGLSDSRTNSDFCHHILIKMQVFEVKVGGQGSEFLGKKL